MFALEGRERQLHFDKIQKKKKKTNLKVISTTLKSSMYELYFATLQCQPLKKKKELIHELIEPITNRL
jgi:hypothetical protein